MHFAVTTLTQTNEYNGADQRIKKTETAGTSPADVVEYFYQDREVLYTYCANNPVKYSDPSGHFIWFAIGAAMAVCDGVSAYHKAKKQGKKGWKLVGAVAKRVAVGAVFGKVGKAFKAGKVAAKVAKKVFKSKTVKKLEKKLVKKIYKRPIHKKTISKTGKVKRKPALVKSSGANSVKKAIKFKGDEAVAHFEKHGKEVMDALGKDAYNLKDYINDANHIIKNGTYVKELNGYVKLIGGKGSVKFGFVGIDRATGNITTFHIKTASELSKKAPSLGIMK